MTEADARDIVERYEGLARAIAAAAGYSIEAGSFHLHFPIELHAGKALITENDAWADDWKRSTASMDLD